MRSFDISLISAWTNGWVKNRDLICHRAHYDVTAMPFTTVVVDGWSHTWRHTARTAFYNHYLHSYFVIIWTYVCISVYKGYVISTCCPLQHPTLSIWIAIGDNVITICLYSRSDSDNQMHVSELCVDIYNSAMLTTDIRDQLFWDQCHTLQNSIQPISLTMLFG